MTTKYNSATERAPMPTFIIDTPAPQDELNAHSRVADAIAAVIQQDHRVKMIGLLGRWGSGKSTVVRLVQSALAQARDQKTYHCFTFDAWQHQSDPPRRAFLEALFSFLTTTKGFEDLHLTPDETAGEKTWRAQLDALNKQSETTTTTVTPTLTRAGPWFLVALMLIPIGLKLIGDGSLSAEDQKDYVATLLFWIGWGLIAAPVLVAGVIYVLWRPKISPLKPAFWVTNKTPHNEESLLSIVANKHVEKRQELKLRSGEPTAIEFQATFRDFVKAAQTTKRRLIIVVDNLDRLPQAEAKTIWATVRSLFLGPNSGEWSREKTDMPTVLVPIDEASVGKIYGGEANGDDGLSRSFIEKTFDLVFQVPSPVLSRWHLYLRSRLTDVFDGAVRADWSHVVGSLYEQHLAKARTPATPRTMNMFVNALATLWIQRATEPMHIGIIAYFVLEQEVLAKDIHAALQVPNEILQALDPEWRIAVAALHFGVSREDGRELFMEGPIRTAIQASDQKAFDALSRVPGFERYYLRVLTDTPYEAPAFAAARLLNGVGQGDDAWINQAWERLRKQALDIPHAMMFSMGDAAAVEILAATCDAAERPRFVRALANAVEGMTTPNLVRTDHAEMALVIEALTGLAGDQDDFTMAVPGGLPTFVSVVAQPLTPETVRRIRPSVGSLQDVVGPLGSGGLGLFESGAVTRAAAALAAAHPQSLDWSPLTTQLRMMLQSGDPHQGEAASGVVVDLARRLPGLFDLLAQWRDESVFNSAWHAAWMNASDQALGSMAAILLAVGGRIDSIDGRSWDDRLATAPAVPRLIDDALKQLGAPGTIDWLAERARSYPADIGLLRMLTARRLEAGDHLPADAARLFADPASYLGLFSADQQIVFWGDAAEQLDGFWPGLMALRGDTRSLVLHALIGSEAKRPALAKALKQYFAETDTETWAQALHNGSEPYGLVNRLNEASAAAPPIGSNAFTALHNSLRQMVDNQEAALIDRWFTLAASLNKNDRQTLFKALAGILRSGLAESLLLPVLTRGGDALLDDVAFTRHADENVVHIVLPLLSGDGGRHWLLSRAERVSSWIAGADRSTRESLDEQLIVRQATGGAYAAELLEALTGVGG